MGSGIASMYIASAQQVGFGIWEQVSNQVLTGVATQIDFTGLNLSTDKYYRILLKGEKGAGGAARIDLYYNDDVVNANYTQQSIRAIGDGHANIAAYFNAGEPFICLSIPDSVGYSCDIFITYTGTHVIAHYQSIRGLTAGNTGLYEGFHLWETVSTNVTKISLVISNANDFTAGTQATLLKFKPT